MPHNKNTLRLYAACVAIGGKGVLLLGKFGSGKSDLALRLIDTGASLVADDQVEITLKKNALFASPPHTLRGLIEARGVGILPMPYQREAKLALAVRLVPRPKVERLPEPEFFDCLGGALPLLSLHAFDASTPSKIRLYLQCQP